MSMSYNPSDGATTDSFWAPIFLGYRDITGQAPIDKVAYPGVSVKAACSPNNVFDKDEYETCISNLLAAQFRRFIFDLYWDTVNRRFNLCPVALPHQDNNATTQPVSSTPATSATKRALASSIVSGQAANATAQGSSTVSGASRTSTSSSAVPTTTGSTGSPLYQFGQYRCSHDLTLQAVLKLFDDYIENTSDQVLARMLIMELNLHAAASSEHPDGPAQIPSSEQMPSGSELVGNTVNNDEVQRDLYKLSDLRRERSNLNASWYAKGAEGQLPFTHYFTVQKNDNGDLSTDDGWPNEEYLLFTKLVRMLVSWGTVDEQMKDYNFGNDSSAIFPQGYMQKPRPFEESATGIVTSGCFFNDQSTDVARVNNSWAMGSINNTQNAGQATFINNLTACGILPVLNVSLSKSSAADDYRLYQQFTESSVFGWATGEPQNATSPGANVAGDHDKYRCVVLDASDLYHGHWRVDNCQKKHRAACRIDNQPYSWRLTSSEIMYENAPAACQGDTSFSLPRTGLENTYLYQHILNGSGREDDTTRSLGNVWINLNAIDVQDCWVTSGPNGNCVYSQDQKEVHDRQILIPTIAALIVLVLTILTIAIKCNNNIRHYRRSKTGPGGWEYEGVPS